MIENTLQRPECETTVSEEYGNRLVLSCVLPSNAGLFVNGEMVYPSTKTDSRDRVITVDIRKQQ